MAQQTWTLDQLLKDDPDNPARPRAEWLAMAQRWELIEDLLGGTPVMRKAGQKWYPRGATPPEVYAAKLESAVLYEGFGDTVEKIVAKPFSRDLSFVDAPAAPWWEEFVEDADGEGLGLFEVALSSFEDGLTYGLSHLALDFPRVMQGQSRADVRGRPFVRSISAKSLVSWDPGRNPQTGRLELTRAAILDTSDPDLPELLVITKDAFTVWNWVVDAWVQAPERTVANALGYVPVWTWYAKRTGFMTARPPLERLAWKNLEHWQSSIDDRHVKRFLRTGTFKATGVKKKELQAMMPVVIGVTQMLHSEDPAANFDILESSGAAVRISSEDLAAIKDEMTVLGAMPFIAVQAQGTATAQKTNAGERLSLAQLWVRRLSAQVTPAVAEASRLMGAPVQDAFEVGIYSDFAIVIDPQDAALLLQARLSGAISPELFLREWQRRGKIWEGEDLEDELQRQEKGKQTSFSQLPFFAGNDPKASEDEDASSYDAADDSAASDKGESEDAGQPSGQVIGANA